MNQNNESFWEALKSLRDTMDDEVDIFDAGFTITEHGKDEFTTFVVECPNAFQWSWTIKCDLSTGFWTIS